MCMCVCVYVCVCVCVYVCVCVCVFVGFCVVCVLYVGVCVCGLFVWLCVCDFVSNDCFILGCGIVSWNFKINLLLTPSEGDIVFDNCLNIKCWSVLRVYLPREPLLQLVSCGIFCLCIWNQLCNVTHYDGYIIGCYRHIIPYIQYSVRVFMCFISLLWLMSKYVILCCGNKCNITNFNLLWLIYVIGILSDISFDQGCCMSCVLSYIPWVCTGMWCFL